MGDVDINLDILKIAVKELSTLSTELVFVGGSTISLYITEPQHINIRETLDVDCIVEVIHRLDYEKISQKLRHIGFNEDQESRVLCRFKKGEIILDVMPTDPSILGFTNIWYREGFKNSIKATVGGLEIQIFDLAYLIASKLEAFKGRGRGDYRASHDIEDIVTVFDGRSSVADDLSKSSTNVLKYLVGEFSKLRENILFTEALDAHIANRENLTGRKKIIQDRISHFLSVSESIR